MLMRETRNWFWSADENDYVDLACREERKTDLLRDMKWVNVFLVLLLQWMSKVMFTATLHLIRIEIPDDAQINDVLYTSLKFFIQGTNL